jgi:uncharacterized membrane protein YedE/YeeE
MGRNIAGLLAGLLMGAGLAVAQMINPQKVIAFLDLAGDWDPSLAVVLASALAVSFVGYRMTVGQRGPVFADTFQIPTRRDIDMKLVAGAALFGIGWGMGGYCPGPAISALSMGLWEPVIFVAAMLAGFAVYDFVARKS